MPETARDRISETIQAVLPDMVALRHYLHTHPELSLYESKTAALIAEKLRELGLDSLRTGVGGHGVVAELKGAKEGPTVALRGDMDALPIQEESDLPYKSCVPGVMHACGHDGHTSNLLGAAAALLRLRDQVHGTVRFLFQPSEEIVVGARAMCDEGVMEGVDAVFGLHGWPGLAVGKIGVRPGPMMASSDTFVLRIQGKGAHAAMPHVSVDPVVIGSQIVMALQTLASREINPNEALVVTVAKFHAGTADNIIPETALLEGTVRCLKESVRKEIPERMERIISGICAAHRAEYTLAYRHGTGVTLNDPVMNDLVAEVGRETLGAENVVALEAPSMGAEDFSVYASIAPGAFFRLGVGEQSPNLHTPRYNFVDEALPHGIELFTRIALRYGQSAS